MVLSEQLDELGLPPTDLWSDEPPLETERHLRQIILFLASLEWWWRDRPDAPPNRQNNFFAAGNLSIYYSLRQRRSEDFRGPDFFVVLDVEYKERKSWTVWEEEGKYPNFILEILSDSTAQVDRGLKKQIYQDIFRTPEYFWFDPYSFEFKGFRLKDARQYEELTPNDQGWLWSQQLELYLGIVDERLRFLTPEGEVVPAPNEAAIQERRRAEMERQRAERAEALLAVERERSQALEARLRKLEEKDEG
jgi:Uma2 family endonuclease